MASNPLWRPAEGPGRFSGVAPAPQMPRVPANALRIPPQAAPINPLAAAVPQAPIAAPPSQPAGIDIADPISERVPVPKGDFPQAEHQDLHEKTMGAAFDEPGAAHFVRELYNRVRGHHPDIEPRHLLETTRDTWHAMRHGFMPPAFAGATLAARARSRQATALRDRLAEERGNVGVEQDQK